MRPMTRLMLASVLALATAGAAFAQETATTTAGATSTRSAKEPATDTTSTEGVSTATAEQTTTATSEQKAENERDTGSEVRSRFVNVVGQHSPDLAMVLRMEPDLLANAEFVSRYPELAAFLQKHPEIAQNPRFYVANFRHPANDSSPLDDIFEAIAIVGVWTLSTFALGWLIRTIIEQKRWNKLSKAQSEVHNKILDRFGSSEELLRYIQTPAGTKFLEAAPIPVHAKTTPSKGSLTWVIRSIQTGTIIAVAALGFLFVSLRFDGETSRGLFAMGMIAFCLGGGFIASAAVSLFLSRRLGLWQEQPGEVTTVE